MEDDDDNNDDDDDDLGLKRRLSSFKSDVPPPLRELIAVQECAV